MANSTITVTFGEQTFAPVSYNNFKVGPISVTIEIKDGETIEQAGARAYGHLENIAKWIYPQARQFFWDSQKAKGVQQTEGEY